MQYHVCLVAEYDIIYSLTHRNMENQLNSARICLGNGLAPATLPIDNKYIATKLFTETLEIN